MRGSAALRASVAPGGALAGPWVRDELWRRARAVPSLDLRFDENKSLVDATTGAQLVTFTRASGGTYVDSQGVIRTATTNLLLRSEEFDNAYWSKSNTTVTQDATTAPNGTITADLVIGTGATDSISRIVTIESGAIVAFSIYMKRSNMDWVRFTFLNGANEVRAWFNLSTGMVGTVNTAGTGTSASASIQNIGDGWYRCTLFGAIPGATSYTLFNTTAASDASFTRVTGGERYLWGAQLEQSTTVGEYIPTTSTINSAPRFDHNPQTGESLGLLVEEARTNSIRNSTMVGAVAGTPGTLPTNYGISGLGTLTQEIVGVSIVDGITCIDIRLSGTTSTTQTSIRFETASGAAGANGQTFTFSSWANVIAGSLDNINGVTCNANLYNASGVFVASSTFSGFNLAIDSSSFTRRVGTLTIASATAAFIQPQIALTFALGVAIDITLRIGMPQLEQGAFATSVIPTTTAAATRSADVASISGSNFSSWYRQDEGTVFTDTVNRETYPGSNVFPYIIQIDDGTNNNRISYDNSVLNSGYRYNLPCHSGGVYQGELNQFGFASGAARWASAFRTNDFAFAINLSPSVVSTRTSGTLPNVMTQLRIGAGFGKQFTGTIRRLTYWPTRLSNATLQTITQ